MKISFHINYYTVPGQTICVLGSIPELGSDQLYMAKQMTWSGNGYWKLDIEISSSIEVFDYQYVLIENNGNRILEPWKKKRNITLRSNQNQYNLFDFWRLKPINEFYYTSAFTKNIFVRDQNNIKHDCKNPFIIKVFCPHIEKDQQLAITGNQSFFGFWNIHDFNILSGSDFPEWEICINAKEINFPFEYKYVICDKEGKPLYWEAGENRILSYPFLHQDSFNIVHDYPFCDSQPNWKGAGTVIPVFSLRSASSYGIGDFYDLKLLIDWAAQTNQRLIQLLPLNDTTRTNTSADSYPYSAISIYALHPVYISLTELNPLNDPEKINFFEENRIILNEKLSIEYDSVIKYKIKYLRFYFEQEKTQLLTNKTYELFFQGNKNWLMPYAAFCYFRAKYETADFYQWGNDATYNPERVQKLCEETSEAYPEILFTYFLQYILHTQLNKVSEYARQKGIILKGDLPIGVNRMSVEAWTERAYFNMAEQAGAPPDDFSATGQNWSFPTYNWDIMEKDGYSWWKKRFEMLSEYYDCFRIDHILGFFRIWEIPIDYIEGLCGHFRPALPLTVSEIQDSGIRFDERYTQPRIHIRYLVNLFGDDTERVLGAYLSYTDGEHMVLNPFCDSQRKIEQLFINETDATSLKIKNGLFLIANEVLFLKDPYEPMKYNPRISGVHSFMFKELNVDEQNAFSKLSNYFFFERHNELWKNEALKRLSSLISTTEMLICGEDLGMIPKTVHEVMSQLHILSLELERAPKKEGLQFTDVSTLPYLSVCTTSTHDMNPLRNWWKEDFYRTQKYYNLVLKHEGKAPDECNSDIAKEIITNHLHAPSMLTIIPLQDWLAMDNNLKRKDIEEERINIPADPHHYWRYRMHIPLEKLLSSYEFNQEIKQMLTDSRR